MAFWALLSRVDATIFIVLVIFSMFLMDFRRPSISRSVAKLAVLVGADLQSISNPFSRELLIIVP